MWVKELIKCVQCDEGGDLLVFCEGNDCPIAVHEKCVELPLRFDENRKFYCPYCRYKRDLHSVLVLGEKVDLAKNAMLEFDNFKDGGGDGSGGCGDSGEKNGNGVLISGDSGEGKRGEGLVGGDDDGVGREKCVKVVDGDEAVDAPHVFGEKDGGDVKNREKDELDRSNEVVDNNVIDDESNDCSRQEKSGEDIELNVNEEDENICDKNENKTLDEEDDGRADIEVDEKFVEGDKQVEAEVLPARENDSPKEDEISSDSDSKLHQKQSDHRSKYALRQRHVSPKILSPPRKISKTKFDQKKEVSQSESPSKTQKSSSELPKLKLASEKRKKLCWKPEEEEMLKEGVQKFTSDVNKNIPWRKILDSGRHVFDSTRTPIDLKDKWKNMRAKELV